MVFLWIALYGLTDILFTRLSFLAESSDWWHPLAMLLFSVSFVFWIFHNQDADRIGLRFPRTTRCMEYLDYFILLILPISNFVSGKTLPGDFSVWILLFAVSLTEELFFRGYLLAVLRRKGILWGILGTSMFFSLFHGVNFFQTENFHYTLLQILCAFSVSICYCCIVIRHKSLLPCAAAHFLTNLTATGTLDSKGAWLGLCFSIFLYLACGVRYCYKINRKERC